MQIYIDSTARERLERAAKATGRTVEDLAASAVEEAALDWAKANPEPVVKTKASEGRCHCGFWPCPEHQIDDISEHPMKAAITHDDATKHPLHERVEREGREL